jgi:hypothetical protein
MKMTTTLGELSDFLCELMEEEPFDEFMFDADDSHLYRESDGAAVSLHNFLRATGAGLPVTDSLECVIVPDDAENETTVSSYIIVDTPSYALI